MHRWFFANDHITCKKGPSQSPSPVETPRTKSPPACLSDVCWKFNVQFNGSLCCNETLAVCGSSTELGEWNVQQCLPLSRLQDSPYWTLSIESPPKLNVYYRYLVCATNESGRRIVRFWETHVGGRLICWDREESSDIFGMLDNKYKLERGWLTTDICVVQFKFYNAPFTLKLSDFKPLLHVKMTPLNVKIQKQCEKDINRSIESHTIIDHDKEKSRSTFAYCEVVKLQDQNDKFTGQPKYGTSCGPDDMLIFHLTLADIEHTAYLIDLYCYPPKFAADVPPYHFGYQYILPEQLKNNSEGILTLNIMCAIKHRPIGSTICDYLVVKPLLSHNFIMQETFQRHWNSKHKGMEIGHRGCGKSFRFQNTIIRENTIHSFDLAFEHGAEMIEFVVQLTKDLVPIVYHDYQLSISQTLGSDIQEYDIMRLPLDANGAGCLSPLNRQLKPELLCIPLNKLTIQQLQSVSEIPEDFGKNSPNSKHNQPFPQLETVLEKVNSKLGFIIQIKRPQTYNEGSIQKSFKPSIDINTFIDKILDLVLNKAGPRRIIVSSPDADICTMIRLKQNRFPVLFSILANKENRCMDPRGDNINMGIYFANAIELLGIFANCGDIMKTPGIISDAHDRDLYLFCYGKEARMEKTRKCLQSLGVDGIVFDRINHVLDPPDLKHNIFLIELVNKSAKLKNRY